MRDDSANPFAEHPSRAEILNELHARPFLPLDTPRRIYHFAFLTDHEQAQADREAILSLACAHGVEPPEPGAKFHYFILGDWRLRWEQHTEFVTYSWSTGLEAATPFIHADPLGAGEIVFRPPGPLIVATHLAVVGREHPLIELIALFNSSSLCVIGVDKGGAEVVTDFAVDAYGFTRLAIRSLDAPRYDVGRITQRVLEIETYRSMALLGLPLAREVTPALGAMERELAEIMHELGKKHDMQASHSLLRRLSDLVARSEALSTRIAFRFGASRAYHAIVKNRLELLQETKQGHYPTISNFFSARLDPAVDTCNAAESRQTRFSTRIERATTLMRTGITLEMEKQNSALLNDMNRRNRLQMRLNRFVQGISFAGLVYYLSGLFGYMAKALKEGDVLPKALPTDVAVALGIPLALLLTMAFMTRVRRLSEKAKEEEMLD